MAYDRHRLAGLDRERDVTQHPVGLCWRLACWFGVRMAVGFGLFGLHAVVGEPDVVELDPARTIDVPRRGGAYDFGRGVEQLEDAFARGHGGLQDVVLLA